MTCQVLLNKIVSSLGGYWHEEKGESIQDQN